MIPEKKEKEGEKLETLNPSFMENDLSISTAILAGAMMKTVHVSMVIGLGIGSMKTIWLRINSVEMENA